MLMRKINYIFESIGLGGISRAICYGVLRDRADRRFFSTQKQRRTFSPRKLTSYDKIPGGMKLTFDNASLEVKFLTRNMLVISWEPGKSPAPYTIADNEWFTGSPEYEKNENHHSLSYGELRIDIDVYGGIRVRDLEGKSLRIDHPPIRSGNSWKLSTELAPDEHIYGLGERAARLNLRPGNYSSWNTDPGGNYSHGADPLYIGTPIYLSISDAGNQMVYFENSYHSNFRIGEKFYAEFSGGMLRYYLIFSGLEEIYHQLGKLVGRPFLPPRWALGYHQSRWGYHNEADIKNVIKGFQDHHLPISAIHLDIDYMRGFRVFTIDGQRFPSLGQLANDLAQQGIKIVTIIDPTVKVDGDYEIYREGISKDMFCKLPDGNISRGVSWPGWSVFPDFSKPETRNWWSDKYQSLVSQGVAGIWHDMNEPSSFAAWGDKSLPTSTQHDMDGRGGDHQEAHNLYGLLMNRTGYEALHNKPLGKRPWILSRSGWAGSQRYAWCWTGDIASTWGALRQTIPSILGLGLSGHAFSGVDIGGFSGDPNEELYLRWFQLASFLPFFRTHSAVGTKPREPWVYGEPITSIIRNFLNLRYKLMPYWYTLAWDAAQSGIPPLRPIFWENSSDQHMLDIEDEFMVGDAFLVAPILHPNQSSRHVILPPGTWYSFWEDVSYMDEKSITCATPLDRIPCYVKSGSMLPMEEDGNLCFHIYPSEDKNSDCHVYSDSGDGYGSWRVDRFHSNSKQKSLEITWVYEGDYPFPQSTVKFQVHGKNLTNATCNGHRCDIHDNSIYISFADKILLNFE
jgi:alpha-glucosidase